MLVIHTDDGGRLIGPCEGTSHSCERLTFLRSVPSTPVAMAPVAQITSSLLLGFALCFMVLAVCLNHWAGGNLLHYGESQGATTAWACAALLITGVVLWTAAFILGLVRFCSHEDLIGQRGVGFYYLLTLYFGTALSIIGVLVYVAILGEDWSYLLAVTSWTSSFVVSVMAVTTCRCGAKRP
ncbi:hypothetical protein ECG_03971 [Echinococcus granulosus]|uniref:Expressed conserved protein n=2 Tax=Echinococcus granulosus TaxID=6210 RepID=A0A068WJJ5_ECHGR|nr:hypothetical protein ECG_03971 [Echinococcus granulosus]CDS17754.1 expressed conserved protein [Echinococcus granulosus]